MTDSGQVNLCLLRYTEKWDSLEGTCHAIKCSLEVLVHFIEVSSRFAAVVAAGSREETQDNLCGRKVILYFLHGL